MESANLHQLQQSLARCFLATQSEGFSTIHEPNSSHVWNGNDYNSYINESYPNTKEFWPKNENPIASVKTSVIGHEFGFHDIKPFIPQSTNELQLGNIEERMPVCLSKSSEMNQNLFNSSYIKNENLLGLDQNIRLNSFSCGRGELYPNAQKSSRLVNVYPHAGPNFNHVGITNVANMDMSSAQVSSSLGLKKTMDLMEYTQHDKSCSKSFGGSMFFHYDHHMHESSDSPSYSSNKMKTSVMKKEVLGTKKFKCYSPEMKPSHRTTRKSRAVLSQSLSPTLKVRKEKLGGRIAALHRIVAPFGKTDTASVLTEAIGYIQFLQDQIQTLSIPYMNSTRNNQFRTVQARLKIDERKEEQKIDLRSKGLCLVPSCFTSFISTFNGGID